MAFEARKVHKTYLALVSGHVCAANERDTMGGGGVSVAGEKEGWSVIDLPIAKGLSLTPNL